MKPGLLLAYAALLSFVGEASASAERAEGLPPPQPSLDEAGNYSHEAGVGIRVVHLSSTEILLECTRPATATSPANVWRERFSLQDGKLVLTAVMTQHSVPAEAAHTEWQETTLTHSAPAPAPKVKPAPMVYAGTNFATGPIGPTGLNPRWSEFGPYIKKLIETVQTEWDRLRIASKLTPKSGSRIAVKFILNAKGEVSRIVNVDSPAGLSEAAGSTCIAAILAHAPYGEWTEEMVTAFGPEQDITFTFYYP